ncbi:MAG: hypothetical protein R6V33_03130 [Pelovirga sp.]
MVSKNQIKRDTKTSNINPLDLVGVALFASAGATTASVIKPAIAGALCGVIGRAILHLFFF